jgi:arylsulfatase A-like enzyme
MRLKRKLLARLGIAVLAITGLAFGSALAAEGKKPNIVMLMQDDTGWTDFGAYLGGAALGHPTPNVDQLAKEGVMFSNWYGQASCTAGRSSFMTGRYPIRTALSVVVAPGDKNSIRKQTPTIAEFFKKNGYRTYFSGKWHLGDKPDAYPIEHGFDEMKNFAAYYAGVYTYNYTNEWFHPWFPTYNKELNKKYNEIVNLYEWEGEAGKPAKKGPLIDWDYLAELDVNQAKNAVEYIKKHANDDKPFFMDVNWMKMHNPNNPSKEFAGKSRLGRYSDSLMEMDHNIGLVMDAIRKYAPNTIVITTADNGAWQDAWPDAGANPFRGMKGTAFEAAYRVPGIMWWPGHIPAGEVRHEMMTHLDLWSTLAAMVGITPPPHGEWKDNNGNPIYFDSIDNSAYVLGKAQNSARKSWVYIHGESLGAVRRDICGDEPDAKHICIAWKYMFTAKDTWLGPTEKLGGLGSLYNLTMDPYEKYDMVFNGAASARFPKSSPGQYAGMDNGWVLAGIYPVLIEFDKSIVKFPNLERYPGGASNDLVPNLLAPKNPLPNIDVDNPPKVQTTGG